MIWCYAVCPSACLSAPQQQRKGRTWCRQTVLSRQFLGISAGQGSWSLLQRDSATAAMISDFARIRGSSFCNENRSWKRNNERKSASKLHGISIVASFFFSFLFCFTFLFSFFFFPFLFFLFSLSLSLFHAVFVTFILFCVFFFCLLFSFLYFFFSHIILFLFSIFLLWFVPFLVLYTLLFL